MITKLALLCYKLRSFQLKKNSKNIFFVLRGRGMRGIPLNSIMVEPISLELLSKLGIRFSGQVYKYWVGYCVGGKQYFRRYVTNRYSRTVSQAAKRSKFALGISTWLALSDPLKLYWLKVGMRKDKPITSCNAFMSAWLRDLVNLDTMMFVRRLVLPEYPLFYTPYPRKKGEPKLNDVHGYCWSIYFDYWIPIKCLSDGRFCVAITHFFDGHGFGFCVDTSTYVPLKCDSLGRLYVM